MKYYNTFKRSNGSYVTQEWSAQEMMDYDILAFVFKLFIGALLSSMASAFCLVARLWDYEEDEKQPSLFGILCALYFIIDYHNQWVIYTILTLIEDAHTIKVMATWNTALLPTHILLLIFGDTLFFNLKNGLNDKKFLLSLACGVTLAISYFIATYFV